VSERQAPLSFEQTVERLVRLAGEHAGTLTRVQVEADDELGRDRALTSAAAHSLAGGTNVVSTPSEGGWFPYEWLTFGSALRAVQ